MDVYPTVRFRDTPKAIEWLVDALGFEQHMLVPGVGEGEVTHAELKLGKGMIMIGDDRRNEDPIAQPPGSAAAYLVIDDPDARYARAKQYGAKVVRELSDTDYGSREFTVRDPEGNVWSFGTYDPFNPRQ